MNVDRYVTYPVVRDAWLHLDEDATTLQDAEMILRSAVPGILAAHRADLLAEAAGGKGAIAEATLRWAERELRGSGWSHDALRCMADEAVADGR